MNFRVTVNVATVVNGQEIGTSRGNDVSYTNTYYESELMKDKYKALIGDGQMRVSIGVDEKIGGPHYSSVSVRVNITASCDQNADTARALQEELFQDAQIFLDGHIEHGMKMLDGHLRAFYPEDY